MRYKIAVCDDSDADRQYILNMVNRWAASSGHAVHTELFACAESFLFRYADVRGNYVTIHALSDLTVKMTLGKLEKQLDERFCRAGRSAIINLTQISRVTRTEIKLSDGTAIPLPRGAYEGINRAIINMR